MLRRLSAPLLVVAVIVSAARASELHVPANYATIQEAIDASGNGDTIIVQPGTYDGPLSVIDRHVIIQGFGAEQTILDGQGASVVVSVAFGASTSSATLRHLTVTGGNIGGQTDDVTYLGFVDCVVRDNLGVGATGRIGAKDTIFQGNGSHGLDSFWSLDGCTFVGNGGWGAQRVEGFTTTSVTGCRFEGNALGGLRLAVQSPSPIFTPTISVQSCLFVEQNLQVSAIAPGDVGSTQIQKVTVAGGMVKVMSGASYLTNCILRDETPVTSFSLVPVLTYCDVQGGWAGDGNIDADPLFAGPGAGDWSLLPGSPCINTGHPGLPLDPDGSVSDMGAFAFHPWSDLGGALAGSAGLGALTPDGPVIAGMPVSLFLAGAPASTPAWLVVGLSQLGAPFKGGTLWPNPDVLVGPLTTTAIGTLPVASPWPAGLPDGFTFWAQFWWADAAGPLGWAASNGLQGVQP